MDVLKKGYKIPEFSLSGLQDFMKEVQSDVIDRGVEHYSQRVVDEATRLYDMANIGISSLYDRKGEQGTAMPPLEEAVSVTHCNFLCKALVVLTDKRFHLCEVRTADVYYDDVLESYTDFEEFPRSEDIWDESTFPSFDPLKEGVSFLLNHEDGWNKEEFDPKNEYVPDHSSRAKSIALSLAVKYNKVKPDHLAWKLVQSEGVEEFEPYVDYAATKIDGTLSVDDLSAMPEVRDLHHQKIMDFPDIDYEVLDKAG